jgi:hypothetical protein
MISIQMTPVSVTKSRLSPCTSPVSSPLGGGGVDMCGRRTVTDSAASCPGGSGKQPLTAATRN